MTGHVVDSAGTNLIDLKAGGLYFGGAGNTVPIPSLVPDTVDNGGQGGTWTKVTACTGASFTIAATNTTDLSTFTHPNRHCSSAGVANPEYPGLNGCLFGPPLAVPNGNSSATSTCIVNRVATTASGSGACNGDTTLSLPLASDIYLTGPTSGLVPCPLCTGTPSTCSAGPNAGQQCTPESDVIPGQSPAANPTSHDCPPTAQANIGALPIPFNLSTGSQSKTSVALGTGAGQSFVFCGFCGQQFSPSFEGSQNTPPGPAHPCTADSQCTTTPFTKCRQRDDGAFDPNVGGPAKTITETGTSPGCLQDGTAHPIDLVSVFCIPPSFNATVDGAADLPGPGAVSLPGTSQLIP